MTDSDERKKHQKALENPKDGRFKTWFSGKRQKKSTTCKEAGICIHTPWNTLRHQIQVKPAQGWCRNLAAKNGLMKPHIFPMFCLNSSSPLQTHFQVLCTGLTSLQLWKNSYQLFHSLNLGSPLLSDIVTSTVILLNSTLNMTSRVTSTSLAFYGMSVVKTCHGHHGTCTSWTKNSLWPPRV